MTEARNAIRKLAQDYNRYLSGAIDDLEKAQREAMSTAESQSAAMTALHAIEGDSEVIERGRVLAARVARLLPSEPSSSEGSDRG